MNFFIFILFEFLIKLRLLNLDAIKNNNKVPRQEPIIEEISPFQNPKITLFKVTIVINGKAGIKL